MTEAEKILNKFIKGDIARDYDEASRKHHTITLQTALEAINVALNKPNVSGSLHRADGFKYMCSECGKGYDCVECGCSRCNDR